MNLVDFGGTAQKEQLVYLACETAANVVITLAIMLVRIVLHVHPMPVIQEFELIEINSFIHGWISYKHAGFHYISYILQLKRGALEV